MEPTCKTCGSEYNQRDLLDKAEREIDLLRQQRSSLLTENEQLRGQVARGGVEALAARLAGERAARKADRERKAT